MVIHTGSSMRNSRKFTWFHMSQAYASVFNIVGASDAPLIISKQIIGRLHFTCPINQYNMDQFCDECEAVLMTGVVCDCGHRNTTVHNPSTIRVWFNKKKELLRPEPENRDPETEGPRVEKFCNKCNALTVQTYFTAQLRSADEGQTVFYRCTKCLIQTSENS